MMTNRLDEHGSDKTDQFCIFCQKYFSQIKYQKKLCMPSLQYTLIRMFFLVFCFYLLTSSFPSFLSETKSNERTGHVTRTLNYVCMTINKSAFHLRRRHHICTKNDTNAIDQV